MKKIIVIGGGFAGASATKILEEKFDVTLIDTKRYFEFTPGVPRAIVEPQHLASIRILHSVYLKQAKVILGKAERISKNIVRVNGTKIIFDYCVICSGSRYEPPIKIQALNPSRLFTIEKYHLDLEKAGTVLIIGGGLVGVELAGEICNAYPSKKVILAHSHDRLGERMVEGASKYFYDYLSQKGVKVLLNTEVTGQKGKSFSTKKGGAITADRAFLCTGIEPNSEFVAKTMPSSLDGRGHVLVNKYLQVKGFRTIFAAGDVNNIREEKTAQNAREQVKIVVKNIISLECKKSLMPYLPGERVMVTSLGKYNGVITYRNFSFTGILAGLLKHLIEWGILWKYR